MFCFFNLPIVMVVGQSAGGSEGDDPLVAPRRKEVY